MCLIEMVICPSMTPSIQAPNKYYNVFHATGPNNVFEKQLLFVRGLHRITK